MLTGHANPTTEALLDEARSVTVDDVQAVGAEATGSALLQIPAGLSAQWAGYAAAPTYSTAVISGKRYASRQSDKLGLVVGTEGVSLVDASNAVTVRYTECAIAMAWPDGGRHLIGLDGIAVRVEPTLYHVPPGLIARIDASVPPAHLVHMPTRDPGAIPQPVATPVRAAPKRRFRSKASFVILRVLATIMSLLTIFCGFMVFTADPHNPDEASLRDPVTYTMLSCMLATTLAFVLGAVLVWRRRRAG